jgi:tRNA-Thr(GGU) m(6)t(6)A37 methyltransferase TsaA
MRLALQSVGEVRSPVSSLRKDHWGEVVSELHFSETMAKGLQGIEQFSHLLVLFWMHRASFHPERDLQRRPGGRSDMPRLGIFAQRGSPRPNALGASVVRLVSHRGPVLRVRGLDAIDGSPILDVKPYFRPFDRAPRPVEPGWVSRLMRGYF